jgi:zinc protease
MVEYDKFVLENGLRVLVHKDESTPIVAFNVLYDVGARDEDPNRTGFAHLFEHLMFGGSVNIPEYDRPLQQVGGENNAFTSNDITNYYLTLPLSNVETAFWLEADRMLSLEFSPKSLEVQRSVVIEEFKQRYLNQPYGDVWLLLRPLAFKEHPYQWPTIGKEIAHIEDATMEDVKAFFFKHYGPQNAVVAISGNVETEQMKSLAEKWFGDIDKREKYNRDLPVEPKQTEARTLTVKRDVPYHAIYKTWHMDDRRSSQFYVCDLISDILSRGKSSRLYLKLVKERELFSEINAYISGDVDKGLFIISGKVSEGVEVELAHQAIDEVIKELIEEGVAEEELQKVKNKIESTKIFSDMNILNKAMGLAYFELLGDANMLNEEVGKYADITSNQMTETAKEIFVDTNSSTLFYLSERI